MVQHSCLGVLCRRSDRSPDRRLPAFSGRQSKAILRRTSGLLRCDRADVDEPEAGYVGRAGRLSAKTSRSTVDGVKPRVSLPGRKLGQCCRVADTNSAANSDSVRSFSTVHTSMFRSANVGRRRGAVTQSLRGDEQDAQQPR